MTYEYKTGLPYPEVSGKICERTLAGLYDVYAGRFSEMTAITTYVYQSIISVADKELADLLEGIAVVEMTHLDMLGAAIFAFGGDPIFAGRFSYFSGSYTEYKKDACAFLKADILGEQRAIEDYTALADKSENQSLSDLLLRIAMDEELHKKLLEDAIARYDCPSRFED